MKRGNHSSSRGSKALVILLALVLVIGTAIGTTVAWLTDQSPTVINTFTSAALFEDAEKDFTLWEHKAVDENTDGIYELTEEEVDSNSYEILPGVDIPKDPTVDVVNLLEDGYLYIKVASNLPTNGISYSIDEANWKLLDGHSDVWVYKGKQANDDSIIEAAGNPVSFTATILTNNQIKVDKTYSGTINGETLVFNAYMVQAAGNGASAAEAWDNTFG